MYRLFSWEHSYFSGKVRAYLRYKAHDGGLGPGYEDILATRNLIAEVLIPATGTNVVPQLQTPDGAFVEDSSEIIDYCEAAHPPPGSPRVIPDPATSPRQCLASHLIELFADEWMVVYGFWERWFYSTPGTKPNHEKLNAQQWGGFLNPEGTGSERLAFARGIFEQGMQISTWESAERGPYWGLHWLGMTERTRAAWTESNDRVLAALDQHLDRHDYALGGLPTLADFGLLGPLYAHLFRDPVAGFDLQTRFPLITEWVERTNGQNALNARMYGQKLYDVVDGKLVGKPATSDGGEVLGDDAVPETLLPILDVFFEEMWPVLESTIERVTRFIASPEHERGGELPGKTFMPSPGFEKLQTGDGPFVHEFEIGGVREKRMVLPYHVWMLERVARIAKACTASAENDASVRAWLARWPAGERVLALDEALAGCRLEKRGGQLFSAS